MQKMLLAGYGTFCGVEKNIPIVTLEVSDKLSDEELWVQNKKVFYKK